MTCEVITATAATDLVPRATITFWWPGSSHPVWTWPQLDGRSDYHRSTYAFQVPFHKHLVQRKYRLMRKLGAPPIAARWACDTECQRQLHCNLLATWDLGGGVRVSSGPMAFLLADPDGLEPDTEPDDWFDEEETND